MSFIYLFAIFFFMTLCCLLCFVILIQESKTTGLGASFGGDTGDSLFGASTPDVLKKITGWLATGFLVSCLLLSFWTSSLGRKTITKPEITEIEQSQ